MVPRNRNRHNTILDFYSFGFCVFNIRGRISCMRPYESRSTRDGNITTINSITQSMQTRVSTKSSISRLLFLYLINKYHPSPSGTQILFWRKLAITKAAAAQKNTSSTNTNQAQVAHDQKKRATRAHRPPASTCFMSHGNNHAAQKRHHTSSTAPMYIFILRGPY